MEFGNGVTTTYTYSPTMLRLTNINTVNLSGAVLQNFNYTYDGVGNITAITDTVNTASQTFKYDALNRLTQAIGVSYGTKNYTYDQIGNIITKDGLTYTYSGRGACPPTLCGGGPHAVTSLSDGTTITYDLNGNMSTKTKGDVFQYIYDKENRLFQVKKNLTLIAEYLYDGDGGRVQKTSYQITINSVAGGFGPITGNVQIVVTPVISKYVGEMYEQVDNVGTAFIFLGSQRVAAIDTNNGTPVFYHGDHLGSTNVMTDNTGARIELLEYDPYGKIQRHDGSNSNNRWVKQQFTGKKLDDETGLYYFGARYYDPSLGRFITPDTVVQNPADPQTLNRYSYCGNNPINRVDLDGHKWSWKKFFAGVIGAVVGVIVTIASAGTLTAAYGAFWGGVMAGALGGAVGGGITGGILGGGQGALQGALMGAVFGGIAGGIGGSSWSNFAKDVTFNSMLIAGAGYSIATGNEDMFLGGLAGGMTGGRIMTGKWSSPWSATSKPVHRVAYQYQEDELTTAYNQIKNNPIQQAETAKAIVLKAQGGAGPRTFWEKIHAYLNEVGGVMETKLTINMQDEIGFASGAYANVGYIPKGIGYSNGNFLEGGRIGYRWANQYGSGYKIYALKQIGFASAALNVAGAALSGYSIGETIDSYYYGYVQYQAKYGIHGSGGSW